MTVGLYPSGRIHIQQAGDVDPASGEAKFFVLPIAGHLERQDEATNPSRGIGLVSACEVEFASTDEGTAAVATFQVDNLSPDTIRQIAQNGFVRIEAGYDAHPSRSHRTIFYGRLDKPKYRIEAGSMKWLFSAVGEITGVDALRPKLTLGRRSDGTTETATVGELIRRIADNIGIGRESVVLPAIFDGDLSDFDIAPRADLPPVTSSTFTLAITKQAWTTTGTAIEEIGKLIDAVKLAVYERFGVVRRFGLLPNVDSPFRIVIQDLDLYQGEFLEINLDSTSIMSAGPEYQKVTLPPPEVPPDEDSLTAAPAAGTLTDMTVAEYSVVSVFDSLVSMGLLIRGHSQFLSAPPTFRVTKGKHILNGSPIRWTTEYSGQLETRIEVPRSA